VPAAFPYWWWEPRVALAMKGLGVSEKKIPAILFILAGLAAAAPPVNIWAMVLCAGPPSPMSGSNVPLGLPVIILGTLTIITPGRGEGKEGRRPGSLS